MCGIVCAFNLKQDSESLRPQILEMSKLLRHRGPDWSGIYNSKNAILAHERLAIVGKIDYLFTNMEWVYLFSATV